MSLSDWQVALPASMPPPGGAPTMKVTIPRGRVIITEGGKGYLYVLDEVRRWPAPDPTPEPGWLKRLLRWFG
jgi:hypothetical protein